MPNISHEAIDDGPAGLNDQTSRPDCTARFLICLKTRGKEWIQQVRIDSVDREPSGHTRGLVLHGSANIFA